MSCEHTHKHEGTHMLEHYSALASMMALPSYASCLNVAVMVTRDEVWLALCRVAQHQLCKHGQWAQPRARHQERAQSRDRKSAVCCLHFFKYIIIIFFFAIVMLPALWPFVQADH